MLSILSIILYTKFMPSGSGWIIIACYPGPGTELLQNKKSIMLCYVQAMCDFISPLFYK